MRTNIEFYNEIKIDAYILDRRTEGWVTTCTSYLPGGGVPVRVIIPLLWTFVTATRPAWVLSCGSG